MWRTTGEREEDFNADRLGTLHLVSDRAWSVSFVFQKEENSMKKIGIIMGSDSDLPVIERRRRS